MCRDEFVEVLDAIDLLTAEARILKASGPQVRIVHRFRKPGVICGPGEEVCGASIIHRGKEFPLHLPLALRLLMDYLARTRRFQSGAQISNEMRTSEFYRQHASNAVGGIPMTRSFARSNIRVYIQRLRRALASALLEAGLALTGKQVVVGEFTVGNEIGYKLRASIELIHVDF